MNVIKTVLCVGTIVLTGNACTLSASASDPMTMSLLQSGAATAGESEELKIAALEGLLSASPERSLPLVRKVLRGDSSVEVKRKALFVLGQNELPEAQTLLVEYATAAGELQLEAIRMIGVGGHPESLVHLRPLYGAGEELREAILQAYLIADDKASVYEIAKAAGSDEEFDAAVRVLGAMDARDELRSLLDRAPNNKSLVQAYAISGDLQSLSRLAREASDPEQRQHAIRSIGIIGSDDARQDLEAIYSSADSDELRDAALQGMVISDHDEGVLRLFRQSTDADEKRDLLRTLVMMDSDLALEVIDSTLGD